MWIHVKKTFLMGTDPIAEMWVKHSLYISNIILLYFQYVISISFILIYYFIVSQKYFSE